MDTCQPIRHDIIKLKTSRPFIVRYIWLRLRSTIYILEIITAGSVSLTLLLRTTYGNLIKQIAY